MGRERWQESGSERGKWRDSEERGVDKAREDTYINGESERQRQRGTEPERKKERIGVRRGGSK